MFTLVHVLSYDVGILMQLFTQLLAMVHLFISSWGINCITKYKVQKGKINFSLLEWCVELMQPWSLFDLRLSGLYRHHHLICILFCVTSLWMTFVGLAEILKIKRSIWFQTKTHQIFDWWLKQILPRKIFC